MPWRKLIGAALSAVALAIGLAMLVGTRLPANHTASAGATIPAPPEDVFALLTDPAGFTSWRPGIDTVEVLPIVEGRVQWRETSRFGTMTFVQEVSEPPQLLVVRIVDTDQGFAGSWTYELTTAGDGTAVVITERGEVSNPLFRFMSHYLMGQTGTMLADLKAMGTHFGADVTARELTPSPGP